MRLNSLGTHGTEPKILKARFTATATAHSVAAPPDEMPMFVRGLHEGFLGTRRELLTLPRWTAARGLKTSRTSRQIIRPVDYIRIPLHDG